jgi:hypothetical protein
MLKKVLSLGLITASMLFAHPHYQTDGGIGVQLELVNPEAPFPTDLGFGAGFTGMICIELGHAGELRYMPNIDIWWGQDHWGDPYYDHYWHKTIEVGLNIGDLRYYFPTHSVVEPFVGLGPMVSLLYQEEWHTYYSNGYWIEDIYYHDWEHSMGFNMMGGIDFLLNNSVSLGLLAKGKFGDWDEFKVIVEFLFYL